MAREKPEKPKCAECGSENCTESMEEYNFPYGAGEDQVELTSVIPIHTCEDCRFRWYNWVADEIMDADVQQYLMDKNK
jgi:C4-type Zn-finger protein